MTINDVIPADVPFSNMNFHQRKVYIVYQLLDLWAKAVNGSFELSIFSDSIVVSEHEEYLFSCSLDGSNLLEIFNKVIKKLSEEYKYI